MHHCNVNLVPTVSVLLNRSYICSEYSAIQSAIFSGELCKIDLIIKVHCNHTFFLTGDSSSDSREPKERVFD